jgi:hypothetical protein
VCVFAIVVLWAFFFIFLYKCRMELQESEGNFVMSSGIGLCILHVEHCMG